MKRRNFIRDLGTMLAAVVACIGLPAPAVRASKQIKRGGPWWGDDATEHTEGSAQWLNRVQDDMRAELEPASFRGRKFYMEHGETVVIDVPQRMHSDERFLFEPVVSGEVTNSGRIDSITVGGETMIINKPLQPDSTVAEVAAQITAELRARLREPFNTRRGSWFPKEPRELGVFKRTVAASADVVLDKPVKMLSGQFSFKL